MIDLRNITFTRSLVFGAALLAGTALSAAAMASPSSGGGGHDDDAPKFVFGAPGDAHDIDRTIKLNAFEMGFDPAVMNVKDGETIRFVVTNTGDVIHEFAIDTVEGQAAHRVEMEELMDAVEEELAEGGHDEEKEAGEEAGHDDEEKAGEAHDDPNAIVLAAGETKELIWKFAKADNLEFACNVPGHYEAGMKGDFKFEAAPGA